MTTTIKRGDRFELRWQLVSPGTDLPQELMSTATVRLLAKRRNGGEMEELSSYIIDREQGLVGHKLDGTLAVGIYDLEIEVTQGDTIQTVPSENYAQLYVTQDLG